MAILQYTVAGLVFVITAIFLYFKWIYGYWARRKVPYIKPSFPFGNLQNPLWMKKGFVEVLTDAQREFKSKGARFGGIFLLHKPTFVPVDPDLIKRIMTVDFQHFMNHGNFIDEEKEPLSANLLNMEDEQWRQLRTKLTPTFTSGKMKMMYEQMKSCCNHMTEHISMLSSQKKPLDVKEMVSCYSTDIIGSCAFGLDCNSFKDPNAEFRKYGRLVTQLDFFTALRMFLIFVIPEAKKVFGIRTMRKDVEEFFTNAFNEVIDHRTSTNAKRNDFVQILLELGASHGGSSKGLTKEQMLAQAVIFFGAGFETSSTNLTFCLYELAWNQDIQQRLRIEILEILQRHNGNVTYEAIMEMKYMDQVLDESLRKYPPIPFLNRKCSKDYKVPGSDVEIKQGTQVMISLPALHKDPEHFPEPEKFDPERFSKENKSKIKPFTFLSFGDGPRICIGMRFAVLQNKVALAMILKNYKILPIESTPKSIEINPLAIVTVSKQRIELGAEPI